jgi:hypothetical protein
MNNDSQSPNKMLDLLNTFLKVEDSTIQELFNVIEDHHHKTGEAISCTQLAKELCGDQAFTEVINFTVDKYLNESIERVDNNFFVLRGKAYKKSKPQLVDSLVCLAAAENLGFRDLILNQAQINGCGHSDKLRH